MKKLLLFVFTLHCPRPLMAGGWVLAAYLALGLGVGCQAFYVRPSPAVATPTASRETRARGGHVSGRPNPNRAYQRADWQDCGQTMRRFSGSSESGSSGLSTEAMNHSTSTDAGDAPFHPTRLWWTKSRAEEDATINLVANAGFIVAVALFALVTLLTVDSDVSRGWTAQELILRVPIDNWLAYTETLRDNPVLVKACTSGIVYTLGDWTAQTFEGVALADIKRERVFRSAVAGLLLHGPLSHVWYGACEWVFDVVGWNENWWVTIPKIVSDQIFWGPLWNAVYICFLGVLKRDTAKTIWTAITSTAVPLVVAGLRLWPLAHVITYGVVPTENRLLWVDFVEIIWVTILSRQAADQARSAGDTGEVAADGGGNNAMSSASAVTAEVMVHVSNGEAAGREATFHGSNRATLSGAVPQEGEGQVAAVGGSGGMGADDLDGSVGVEER